ncbi:sulfotransferase [Thalassotalea nanhaiensis]|uniref:Sulfotransferase n=1 Tax=Thalassotalea nanhaiensis TaxID=3065648 RepID=A0ABY9THH7_9GAMM|nr:sulfotransferase [Colwelliaceae bacterium SQ345]
MTDHKLLNLIQNAQQQLAKSNYHQALKLSQDLLNLNQDIFDGWLIKAIACQSLSRFSEALESINQTLQMNPKFEMGYLIKVQVLRALKHNKQAIKTCEFGLKTFRANAQLWLEYSELLYAIADKHSADNAFKQHLIFSASSPNLQQALRAFFNKDFFNSEKEVRQHLKRFPSDASAIRLLGEVALNLGVYEDAQNLFEKSLQLAPNYHLARLNYAHTLNKREQNKLALAQIKLLETHQPNHPPVLIVKAAVLVKLGHYQQAIELYQHLLKRQTNQAELWASLGHTYKTTGETSKAIAAYIKATEINPQYGDAYWSLANMKTYEFTETQFKQMSLAYEELKDKKDENLTQICFALGKAYEIAKEFDQSFYFYSLGNNIKKQIEPYSTIDTEQLVARNKQFFANFKPKHKFSNSNTPVPIFIVGLPRSGSTLLEQILSSHSAIDGTKELPDIMAIARRLGNRKKKQDKDLYPHSLANLTAEQVKELGNSYLTASEHLRNGAPFFIDKMPNNFLHIGLIKTILPQAKIIDARRIPVASGFSCFKQLFAVGQSFSNDINDIKHYYQNYLALMSFWQQTFPDDIYTVNYENVVNNIESEVRQLLTFLNLDFEESCLSFYKNKRAVATASAEQVRQPINNKGLNAWQAYSKHLEPLIEISS